MIQPKTKKLLCFCIWLLIINFITISHCVQNSPENVQYYEEITKDQASTLITVGALGIMVGSMSIIKGIFDALDIPLTYADNAILAKRCKMFKEDLERHYLGKKIISATELTVGFLTIFVSACGIKIGFSALLEKLLNEKTR